MNFACGVLDLAPGLFGYAFYLLGNTGVGQLLVANRFADLHFQLAGYLIDSSFYCFLVHGMELLLDARCVLREG
jgi:hypothetical protein